LIDKLIEEGHASADIHALKDMLQQTERSTLFVEIKNISKLCEPVKNILVKFEGRTVTADKVIDEVSQIDAWLQVRIDQKFADQFTNELRAELPKKAADESASRFHRTLGAMRNKLTGYMSGGAQPAMEFFRSVRLLDPQQHASLNTNFTFLKLPHVNNGDLQSAQEWQQFLNLCTDPGAAANPDVVSLWRSLVPRLPKLAPAALAALSVPAASVDAERSFSIYKSILADNRQSLKMENMAMLVTLKFNAASGLL
jgi:hypothetical protein